MHVLHALLEDRVEPGLTDKKVCPLDYDNADEEPSVTSLLQCLTSVVCLKITKSSEHKNGGFNAKRLITKTFRTGQGSTKTIGAQFVYQNIPILVHSCPPQGHQNCPSWP